jgi:chromosome segregation ATPase
MSDTPRTDADVAWGSRDYIARLERELAAMTAERDVLLAVDAGHLSWIDGLKTRVEVLTEDCQRANDVALEIAGERDACRAEVERQTAERDEWKRTSITLGDQNNRLRQRLASANRMLDGLRDRSSEIERLRMIAARCGLALSHGLECPISRLGEEGR